MYYQINKWILEMVQIYGKWDEAEYAEIAFKNVTSGQWDLARFDAWKRHLVSTSIRDELMGHDSSS